MSDHLTMAGLAERAAKRRRERLQLAALKRPVADYPRDEHKARHRALVYLATLPTKHLAAVHLAAVQHYERSTNSTP